MRFEIEGKAFKDYMDRAMAVVKPGSVFAYMESVEIVANEDGVFLKAGSDKSAVVIRMGAAMIECGSAYIHISDIKRIYNMTGYVTIETIGNRIVIRNGKKKSDVRALTFDDAQPFYSKMNINGELFRVNCDNFLNMLSVTDAAREQNDNALRPIMTGFNINGAEGRVIACDGFRMHAAKLDVTDENPELFFKYKRTICGLAYSQLKKIVKHSIGVAMTAYDYDGCMKLAGGDFDYYVRYLDGEYPDVYNQVFKPVVKGQQYAYTLDVKELQSVAKEYVRMRPGRDENVMYLLCKDSEMVSAFASDNYRTADYLSGVKDMCKVENGHMIGLNPEFVSDAMSALAECTTHARAFGQYVDIDGSNIKPMGVSHDTIDMLLLPVKAIAERVKNIREFVCAM